MSLAFTLILLAIVLSRHRHVKATNDFPTNFPPAFPSNLPYPPSPTPTPTSAPNYVPLLQQNSACCLLSSALSICTSLTPGFTTLLPTKQAECLCYSSTMHDTLIFDNAVKGCAEYASTAAPGAYAAIEGLEDFCANVGAGDSAGQSVTGSETLCNTVSSYLSSCVSQTSDFLNMDSAAQAECLCYSTDSWGGVKFQPDGFDDAVDRCMGEAKTGNGALYAGITALKGFCDAGATTDGGASVSIVITNQPGGGATSTGVHGSKTNTLDVTVTVGGAGTGAGTGKPNDASKKVSVSDAVMICFLITVLVFFLC